jgi:hypothetical protein
MREMQKASAKRQVKEPKSKPKLKNWRKKVDWAAAGRKAYETRMKNQGKHGKTVKVKPKKPQKKPAAQNQVKQHGKRKTVGAFGNYRVNRDALVAELKKSKKTEFAPTEVVSLTWNVIKKASAKQ